MKLEIHIPDDVAATLLQENKRLMPDTDADDATRIGSEAIIACMRAARLLKQNLPSLVNSPLSTGV